jgi:hypothetical protein
MLLLLHLYLPGTLDKITPDLFFVSATKLATFGYFADVISEFSIFFSFIIISYHFHVSPVKKIIAGTGLCNNSFGKNKNKKTDDK